MLCKTCVFGVVIWTLAIASTAFSQQSQAPLNWVQSGNCWVAEPGFLYCSKLHPYAEDNPHPFISFVCHQHYQAVILSHDSIEESSTVRTVKSEFGPVEFTDIWIAADKTDTFMSNNVSASNDGYFNSLKGLGNPNSSQFHFTITPGNVSGLISLTGEEFHAVHAYQEHCSSPQ